MAFEAQENPKMQRSGPERSLNLGSMTATWDKLGVERNLKTDSDIATFLLRYYGDSSVGNQSAACCVNCLTPLTLSCTKCGTTDQPGGGIKMSELKKTPTNPADQSKPNPPRVRNVSQDEDVDLLDEDPASPTAEQVAQTMVQLAFTTEEPPTPVITNNTDNSDGLHACPHCGVKFGHQNGLSRHLSLELCYTKAQEPPLQNILPVRARKVSTNKLRCVECSLEFMDDEQLEEHMKVHTQALPYVCCHCGVGFLEKTILNYHLKTHQGLHICHRCGSEFVNKHGLTAHLKQVCTGNAADDDAEEEEEENSSEVGGFVKKRKKARTFLDKNACKFCGKQLASPSHLKRHLLTHTGERPFVCQACGASFTQKIRLVEHHNRTHATDKPIKCGSCFQKFFTTLELSKHTCQTDAFDQLEYEDDENEENRPFKCQYCNAEFAYAHHLTAHIQTHTGQKEFKCQQCDRAFGAWVYLKQHLKKHNRPKTVTNPEARPYKCHLCTRAFKTRKMLTNHIRVHTGEKPYHCQECGKSFAQRCNYRRHVRIHTGEKPYECKQCGQSFAHRTTYVGHVRAHTGLKPYKCRHCDKAFRQSYSLTIHMRTHTHEKPYTCSQCNSSFSHPSSLTIHMRKHTGEKPFRCPHCEQNFASASNCRAHIRKTHKDDLGTPIRINAAGQPVPTSGRKRGRKPKAGRMENDKPMTMEVSSCAQIVNPPPVIPEPPQPQPPPLPTVSISQHPPAVSITQPTFRPEAIPVYGLWDGVRPPLQFPPPPPDAHSGQTIQMQVPMWNDFRQPHDLSRTHPHPQWS